MKIFNCTDIYTPSKRKGEFPFQSPHIGIFIFVNSWCPGSNEVISTSLTMLKYINSYTLKKSPDNASRLFKLLIYLTERFFI